MTAKPRIVKMPSPNFFEPEEMTTNKIAAVVLHGTSGSLQASLDWLRNPRYDDPEAKVSANYLISKAGVIYELVPWETGLRAMGNGIVETNDSSIKWLNDAIKQKINPNWITVSIEHEATFNEMVLHRSMTDAQFTASCNLTAYILAGSGLKANHQSIIGHNQISGKQKYNCPGVIFPPAYTEQLVIRFPELGGNNGSMAKNN